METALQINSPKPFVVLYDWSDILGYLWLVDYRKTFGRNKAQMLPFDRQTSLRFSDVESPCAIRSEHDSFGEMVHAITGKGLFQLMLFHAMVNAPERPDTLTIKPPDAAVFFEGHDLERAIEFLNQKLALIVDPTISTVSDDPNRQSAEHARTINGETWKQLGVIPQDKPLPEPEPLQFNGKYNSQEMVQHDRQTRMLARAMLKRMKENL